MQALRFRTGLKIRQTGIYRVLHSKHRLPHEVTLLKGEYFPRCSNCGSAVQFELVQTAPDMGAAGGFRIVLYELPAEEELEEKADAEAAG